MPTSHVCVGLSESLRVTLSDTWQGGGRMGGRTGSNVRSSGGRLPRRDDSLYYLRLSGLSWPVTEQLYFISKLKYLACVTNHMYKPKFAFLFLLQYLNWLLSWREHRMLLGTDILKTGWYMISYRLYPADCKWPCYPWYNYQRKFRGAKYI